MTRSKPDPQREDAQLARAIRDRSTRGESTSPRKMSLRLSSGRHERQRSNGKHVIDNRLRVYHQGGLDTYCAFYAILNLVNFLKFKRGSSPDFIGANEFEAFIRFIDAGNFRGFFPERPFGDAGIEAPMLVEALSRTLVHFNLSSKLTIEDDQSLDPYDTNNQQSYFRPGTEKIFMATPADVLGLGVVKEDDEDTIGHWVVFVGKNHLVGTAVKCERDWDGIVLDSDRGYERWRVDEDKGTKLPRISIRRTAQHITAIEWLYSFVSLSFA